MAVIEYQIGEEVGASVTFRAAGGQPTNPTTVTLTVRRPSGTAETIDMADLQHPAEGVFAAVVPVDAAGRWHIHWQASGNLVASVQDRWDVLPDRAATARPQIEG